MLGRNLIINGVRRPSRLALWASGLDCGQFCLPLGSLLGMRCGLEELDHVLNGFCQDFGSVSNACLAFPHAFAAGNNQRLCFIILSLVYQCGSQLQTCVMSIPRVWTIGLAHGQALSKKRLSC